MILGCMCPSIISIKWPAGRSWVPVQQYGRDWKRLQEAVPGKTMTQIKNYYQNYKVKVGDPAASSMTFACAPHVRYLCPVQVLPSLLGQAAHLSHGMPPRQLRVPHIRT